MNILYIFNSVYENFIQLHSFQFHNFYINMVKNAVRVRNFIKKKIYNLYKSSIFENV